MKKLIVLSLLVCAVLVSYSQGTKPSTKPVAKPAAKPAAASFKNLTDSASYAFGVNIAINLMQQGFDKVNVSLLSKAMNDVYGRKPIGLNQQDGNNSIMKLQQTNMYKKYPALKQGEDFLAANAKKPGIIKLPSGLQYEVLKQADSGTISPRSFDTVVVNYAGSLVNGTEFESTFKPGARPAVFALNEVVPGWTEAIQLMHVGDKWRVFIPSELGYHLNPRDPNLIPPGSALIFIISLEGIKPAANPPAINPSQFQQ